MKEFFKSPLVITLLVIVGLGILYFGGTALFSAGQKNALQQELTAVNNQLSQTSARTSSNLHLQLLAKRNALQNLLANL